jgi:hypothetical protein
VYDTRNISNSGVLQNLRFGCDGTARFFALPPNAIITVVAECAGRVQILYDHELYVTFTRNLMLHLKRERDLAGSTVPFAGGR